MCWPYVATYFVVGITVGALVFEYDSAYQRHVKLCGNNNRVKDLECRNCEFSFWPLYWMTALVTLAWPLVFVLAVCTGIGKLFQWFIPWYGSKLRKGVEVIPAVRVSFANKELPPPR